MSPNLSRLLDRWGIGPTLESKGCELQSIDVRRWQDGDLLSNVSVMPRIREKYKSSMYVVHRADFQNVLLAAARQIGVTIHLNSVVDDVDFTNGSIRLAGQDSWHHADFTIGADGVRSLLRQKFLKQIHHTDDHVRPTGDSAYRAILPTHKLKHDSRLYDFVTTMKGTRWIGPGCHIMGYPIRNGEIYNLVLIHPDKYGVAPDSWRTLGSKSDVLKIYAGWDQTLLDLIAYMDDDKIYEWRLADHAELPGWTTPCFALIGDACHPTLPYVAQGSAQAIEDAATIAAALSLVSHKSPAEFAKAMRVYETLRKERAEAVVRAAGKLRQTLHLPDGQAQIDRDAAFRRARETGENPDKWQDERYQQNLFGHDAEAGVEAAWQALANSDTTTTTTQTNGQSHDSPRL